MKQKIPTYIRSMAREIAKNPAFTAWAGGYLAGYKDGLNQEMKGAVKCLKAGPTNTASSKTKQRNSSTTKGLVRATVLNGVSTRERR